MTENWQEQAKKMVEQGKQAAAGFVSGGEMIIDADPEKGFFRVKLRNVNPPETVPQITTGFCWLLANGAAKGRPGTEQRCTRSMIQLKHLTNAY